MMSYEMSTVIKSKLYYKKNNVLIYLETLINRSLLIKIMATKLNNESSEKVGFHKGSLATLSKEREELMRILQIVEQLMQMHIKELKDIGVDLVKEAQTTTKKLKGEKDIADVLG